MGPHPGHSPRSSQPEFYLLLATPWPVPKVIPARVLPPPSHTLASPHGHPSQSSSSSLPHSGQSPRSSQPEFYLLLATPWPVPMVIPARVLPPPTHTRGVYFARP